MKVQMMRSLRRLQRASEHFKKCIEQISNFNDTQLKINMNNQDALGEIYKHIQSIADRQVEIAKNQGKVMHVVMDLNKRIFAVEGHFVSMN